MSHEREVFPTLENDTQQGVALNSRQEGEAAASKNGSIGFAFKDASGNVALPQLNNEGAIPVTSDAGTTKRARGADADGDAVTPMVLGQIVLTVDKSYTKLSAQGSCFRDTEFQVVLIEDVGVTDVETILDEFLTGPGQFTTKSGLEVDIFNTNSFTGTIHIELRAINLNKASKTTGSISVNEVA